MLETGLKIQLRVLSFPGASFTSFSNTSSFELIHNQIVKVNRELCLLNFGLYLLHFLRSQRVPHALFLRFFLPLSFSIWDDDAASTPKFGHA